MKEESKKKSTQKAKDPVVPHAFPPVKCKTITPYVLIGLGLFYMSGPHSEEQRSMVA